MAGEQRFVISARVIGAVYRDAPKLKMFMLSVLWSDNTEVIVYRSFQEFKKFHRLLKKRFPQLNPFRKNNRVIPKFRWNAGRSLTQKGSARSVKRMKLLESYCEKLLRCNAAVTQSSELTQFFMPKGHDLQSDFTKNSVVILLSDYRSDSSDGGLGNSTHQQAGNVTHPFITQTYRCVDAYETKDTKNRPFTVAVDEKLDVLIKDPAGWWLVENEKKCLAWFPAPYLELWDGEEEEDDANLLGGTMYCAVRSYTTKKEDEVSVPIGSVVEVLKKSDNGWWLIRFNGKRGYVPSMYLQPYNNPRAGLYSLYIKQYSSTLNLATSRETQASPPPSTTKENNPQLNSAGPSSGASGRLHKARSLDALSEMWTQTRLERDALETDGRAQVMNETGSEYSFSGLSSSSESSSSLKDEVQDQRQQPGVRESSTPVPSFSRSHSSSTGLESFGDSETTSATPRVPPRPKTEEILTRCTTMTRKAALATKARLQIQPSESIHIR